MNISNFRFAVLFLSALFFHNFSFAQCNPDVTPPVAICNAIVNVALSSDGQATVLAESFDENSFDACCLDNITVKRLNETCVGFETDADYGADVTFCCDDISSDPVFVGLKVTDCAGNFNECFVEVFVDDKLSPTIVCPSNATSTCQFYNDEVANLSGADLNDILDQNFGTPTTFDNCEVNLESEITINQPNACDNFFIERTWTVSDGNPTNNTASCTQSIEVIFDNVWDVDFPLDTTLSCYGSGAFDAGMPVISNGSCALTASAYEDIVLTVGDPDLCLKILRTWTVINWCDGSVQTHTQIINITSGGTLTLTCPENIIAFSDPNTQLATVTLPLPEAGDCAVMPTFTATSDLPNFNPITFSATDVPEGNYTVTYSSTDNCGNNAICNATITVEPLDDDCPADATIDCDFYETELATTLADLEGDSEAQSQFLDQFFGEPSFDAGQNITADVQVNLDQCGEGTITRTWSLGDPPPPADGFTLVASNETANTGDEICVGVSVQDFTNILSMQFSMHFDPNVLQFESVGGFNLEGLGANDFGMVDVANGDLTLSWFDPDVQGITLEDGEQIFEICFTVLGGSGTNSAISFDGNPTVIEVIDANGNEVNVNSVTGSVLVGNGNPPSGDCLILSASSEMADVGDEVCVSISVQNFDDLVSLQYSMDFDETVLEYTGIQNMNLQDLDNNDFGPLDVNQGTLTTAWFDATTTLGVTVPDGTEIYQVCFTVIGAVGDISNISFSSSITPIEAVNGDNDIICVEQEVGTVVVTENAPQGLVVTNNAGQILCTQTITVNHVSDFVVEFPEDVTVECTANGLDAGEPQIFGETCELIAVSWQDMVYTDTPDACYKIDREYTVINWCVVGSDVNNEAIEIPESQLAAPNNDLDGDGDSDDRTFRDSWNGTDFPDASDAGMDGAPDTDPDNNPWDGYITYTQTILVNDNVAPVFANNCELDAVCFDNPFGCIGSVTLPQPLVLDCSPQVDITVTSDLGTGFGPFDNVAPGFYVATYTATDACGNQTICQSTFEVVDCISPVAICDETTMVSLNSNGEATLFAETLDDGSYDNCSEVTFSFTNGNSIDFDCDDQGSNFVELIVTDDLGNTNSCITEVVVVDNLDVCPADPCDDLPTVPTLVCNDFVQVSLSPTGADFEFEYILEGFPAACLDNYNLSFSSTTLVETLHFDCDDIGEQLVVVTDLDSGNACWGTVSVEDILGVCDVDPTDCNNDVFAPTPYCLNGLVVELMNSTPSFIQVWASDFDAGSFDNCTDDLAISFSPDITDNSIIFNCDDLGNQPVQIWVTDEAGNQDFCETFIVIQDNFELCTGSDDCDNDVEAPVVFCANGLVISIPTSGELTLNASTFDIGSLDNCTDQEDLQIAIELLDNSGNVVVPASGSITFTSDNIGANNIVLYVTDEAGNVSTCSTIFLLQSNPPKYITGKIFIDENDDCEYNAGEQGLDTWSVKLELIDDPNATEPGIVLLPTAFDIDADGNYTLTLPDNFEFFTPDSSTVTVNNLNAYLRLSLATTFNYGQSCPYNYFIDAATNVLETVEVDFPVQIIEECPQLAVDISTPFLRRCFDNNYYVNYCNYGTEDVSGVFIEVELDEFLMVNSSSHPWSAVTNNVYTFVLGTVPAAECGTFVINTTVSCDAELGQSHCVDARIFPDVVCTEENENYSGANIEITATCNGDEVEFTIINNGEEDMDEEISYIIIEDFVMYNTTPLTLQLNSGDSETVTVPNNGSTWRVQTEQITGHPVGGVPSATIEGCTLTGDFSTGFVNFFPPGDDSPVISINCMENIGSFDPNDKLAIPTGYGDEHFIKANTDLEYFIRFQNTGTDTAFNIVILDTLSQHLDPNTVRAGASSHSYDFTILGDNVLKFNFDNIMLPDSNINEMLSHGYISFRVSQYKDVPLGTVIENNAAIYFDFNEPIITNTVFHTIGEDFIQTPDNATVVFVPNVEVNVYPNPFSTDATIEISGMNISEGILRAYDVTGKLVKEVDFNQNKFQINAEELAQGMYFYQIFDNQELIANGKFSKQ